MIQSNSEVLDESRGDPQVALLFVPLVETNFGRYYPSTAVLSAYLEQHGIGTSQFDLNEELALDLLSEPRLTSFANGHHCLRVEKADPPAVAARLLLRLRDQLFDSDGAHRFADPKGPGHLLQDLARPLLVDLPVAQLCSQSFLACPVAQFYLDFYARSKIAQRIPRSVHTVGISVPMGPQLGPALVLANVLRAARPELRILLGGPALSLMSEADLEFVITTQPAVDVVVRYDGELPLLSLVQQAAEGRWEPERVPGTASRGASGIVLTRPGKGPRLDDLPFSNYAPELLGRLSNPELGIVQARGCYWGRCTYCDFIELYEGSPKYRTRTVSRFLEEMKHQLHKHSASRFCIITESIPATFARKLAESILEEGLEVRWNSFAMVDQRFSRPVFEKLATSGCEYLVIGMESMTDRVLAHVRKASTQSENERFIRDAHAAKVSLIVNLIPDLPTTTYQESLRSLEAFEALQHLLYRVSVFPFEPTRSSQVGRAPERHGLVPVAALTRSGQAQFASNHLAVHDPAMTPSERQEVHARYREFANRLAASRQQKAVPRAPEVEKPERFRVDDDAWDFVEVGAKLRCTNWIRRDLVEVGVEWSQLLSTLRAAGDFSKAELVASAGSDALGHRIFHFLKDNHFIVAHRREAPRAGSRQPWRDSTRVAAPGQVEASG